MSETEDYQPSEEENADENEGVNQDTNLNSSEPFDDAKEEEGEINEDEQNVIQITDGEVNPEDQFENNTNQSGIDDDRLEEEEDIEKRAEEKLGEEAEDQEVNENDFEEVNDGGTQFDNAPEEQLDEFQSGEVTELQNDLENENADELIDQAQTEEEEAKEEQNNLDQDEYSEINEESTEMVDNYQNIEENIEEETFEDHDEQYNETMEEHIDGEKTPELGRENDDNLEAEEEDEEEKGFDNNLDDTNLQALREFSEAFANQILIAAQNEEQRARERTELNYSESEKEDVENKGIQSTPTIDIQPEDYNTDLQIEISQEAADQRTEADNDPSTTSLYEKDDKELPDMNKNANSLGNWGTNSPNNNFPSPERSYSSIEGQMSTSALNIVWSFGLNRNVPVLNLSDGVRQAIMYSCAHVGIMYDYKNNKQHILQAHLNPITCSAVSQDKRWLVTGDVGPDAMVNIWDTYTGTPIQTMFDPNPKGGVVAVALTPDSRYLATLSALPIQTLAIWDWTVDGDVPICSADLKPEYGLQNFIAFDSTDVHHLVTNSESQVLFYNWEDSLIKYYAPPLSDSDFNKPVGRYSQSMFQIGIARALTATSIGNLVVWDNNRPLSMIMDVNQSADKKPLKIIKVHDKGINVLTNTDNYIVIGDTAGHIKFYDQCLRLIYWYQEFHSGPCTSISFAYMPDFVTVATEGSKYPSDATKQAKPFVIRDFIVGTSIAIYCSINTDGSKIKVIHREHDAAVHALAAHPKLPILAIGSYSGLLKLWNYRTKEVVASRIFEKCHIQCCAFDPKGFYIALGLTNGIVHLVDAVALLEQLKEPFRYAKDTITHITFSHNSQYLATAIEYDLNIHGKANKLMPIAFDRIEQAAIPQCMTKYPPITKENFFLTANDQLNPSVFQDKRWIFQPMKTMILIMLTIFFVPTSRGLEINKPDMKTFKDHSMEEKQVKISLYMTIIMIMSWAGVLLYPKLKQMLNTQNQTHKKSPPKCSGKPSGATLEEVMPKKSDAPNFNPTIKNSNKFQIKPAKKRSSIIFTTDKSPEEVHIITERKKEKKEFGSPCIQKTPVIMVQENRSSILRKALHVVEDEKFDLPTHDMLLEALLLKRKLKKILFKEPMSKTSLKLMEETRFQLRACLESILFSDIEITKKYKVDKMIYKDVYGNVIDFFSKRLKEQPTDKMTKKNLQDILEEGREFFENLLIKLQDEYRFKLDLYCDKEEIPENAPHTLKQALLISQQVMIYLGDIYHYKEQASGTTNFGMARHWYLKAQRIHPRNGRPYNQLAILAVNTRRKLDAVYYYIRSLRASNPILTARESLMSLFEEVRIKMHAAEKKRFEERRQAQHHKTQRRGPRVLPDGTCTKKRVEEDKEDDLKYLSVFELNKRFVLTYLNVHGKLFTKINFEVFAESSSLMLQEFQILIQHSPCVFSCTRLLQLMVINMFSIDNTALKDESLEDSCRSVLQEHAVEIALDMFGLLVKRSCELLSAQIDAQKSSKSSEQKDANSLMSENPLAPNKCEQMADGSLTLDEDLHLMLPALKIWVDWMMCHPHLWNPQPFNRPPDLGPQIDVWKNLATFCDLLNEIETKQGCLIREAQEGFEPVILQEDTTLAGFVPMLSAPQEIFYADTQVDKELAEDWLRIEKLRLFGEYLCGVEPAMLAFNVESGKYYAVAPSPTRSEEKLVTKEDNSGEESDGVIIEHDDSGDDAKKETNEKNNIELLKAKKAELSRQREEREKNKENMEAILDSHRHAKIELEICPIFLIPDTNCFIDHFSSVQKILQSKKYTLVVPLVVINELDGLARGARDKQYDSPDHAHMVKTHSQAAIDFLESEFEKKNPNLKALTAKGSTLETIAFRSEEPNNAGINDDIILNCCLHYCKDMAREFMPKDKDQPVRLYREVVLLTDDRNLRLKAHTCNIPVKDVPNFKRWSKIT